MSHMPEQVSYAPDEVMRRYQQLREHYSERDNDIYISSFSRSGTTWTQMVLYQLTTAGNMDFEHLFDVSPWLFYNALRNTKPVQVPEPRLLKTHDAYSAYSMGAKGRFIYVVRDGRDVLVSMYHHRVNVKGFAGSFNDHFEEFIEGVEYNGHYYNWFYHVKDWVENHNHLPMLLLRYENLKCDFDVTIQKICEFCDIPLTDTILERTRERTSFAFMKAHEVQLGPQPSQFLRTKDAPYKIRSQKDFIRKGSIGEGKQVLTEQQQAIYAQRFQQVLGHIEFLASYGQ